MIAGPGLVMGVVGAWAGGNLVIGGKPRLPAYPGVPWIGGSFNVGAMCRPSIPSLPPCLFVDDDLHRAGAGCPRSIPFEYGVATLPSALDLSDAAFIADVRMDRSGQP